MTPTPNNEALDTTRIVDGKFAAEILGTTHRHVRRMAYDGRLPYLKIGGKQRFSMDDLTRFLELSRAAR